MVLVGSSLRLYSNVRLFGRVMEELSSSEEPQKIMGASLQKPRVGVWCGFLRDMSVLFGDPRVEEVILSQPRQTKYCSERRDTCDHLVFTNVYNM